MGARGCTVDGVARVFSLWSVTWGGLCSRPIFFGETGRCVGATWGVPENVSSLFEYFSLKVSAGSGSFLCARE